MTPRLPAAFLGAPIAHRALHDISQGRPENSRAAVVAAIESGYGIEIDLQLTRDDQAVVFHDYQLDRLTGVAGRVRDRNMDQLAGIELRHGGGEAVPSFDAVLDLVRGQVPLLVELKDQDGAMGPGVGPLEARVVEALSGYEGPVAVMSFNPHSVAEMARLAPGLPRGLVTGPFDCDKEWPVPPAVCDRLRGIPDFDRIGASFISHQHDDLDRDRVRELHSAGVPVLCWTIRSAEEETRARRLADNITFEGYSAPLKA